MPNQYEYGLEFFSRYYRPEYTTIIVAGDVNRTQVRPAVDRYWGKWKRGSYRASIPVEPPQEEQRTAKVAWAGATLPWLAVAFHAPAYSDRNPDWAALNLLTYLGFSQNSNLYQKLVITEQRVDRLQADLVASPDPFLFTVAARLKKPDYLPYVQQQVLQTLEDFVATPVEKDKLEEVKQHLRSRFTLSLNNTEAVAAAVARALRADRSVDTIDRLYDLYSRISPEDIQHAAARYLGVKNRTVVTLTGGQR